MQPLRRHLGEFFQRLAFGTYQIAVFAAAMVSASAAVALAVRSNVMIYGMAVPRSTQ